MYNKEIETQVVLGNAVEIATSIITGVLGNEASDEVDGTHLTRDVVTEMVTAQVQQHLNGYLGG